MTAHIAPAAPVDRQPETPTVSFLVTSYNKAAYLPAVLDSVWGEARAVGGEVILVDDGSSDCSEPICRAFAVAHPSVHYWRQDNQGIYSTINAIAAKARADWVRFCDSDDPLIAGSTERLMRAAEQSGAGVVYGRAVRYGPPPLQDLSAPIPASSATPAKLHPDGLMHLIRGMNFTPSMAIYRRAGLAAALPLPTDLVSCQDLALLFPVIRHRPLAWIEAPVCFSLQGAPNQLSANHALTLQQTIRITQRNEALLSPGHKRAALLKAANRTRRWLRKARPNRNSLGRQAQLLAIVAGARLGLMNFSATLGKIAALYEEDLQPLLDGRAKPF